MSSRKSSASYTKSANVDTASNADLILFQGNRVQQPGRQPKLPPPVERQKDEGFAKFLKQHSSPTHNRVTAGGRIVPMEPRSPPAFTLPSLVTNRPCAVSGGRELQSPQTKEHHTYIQTSQGRQQCDNANFDTGSAAGRLHDPALATMIDFSESSVPAFVPAQHTHGLFQAPVYTAPVSAAMFTPVRTYAPNQQMGGPVMPYPMQSQSPVYDAYQTSSSLSPAKPPPPVFCPSPTWAMYDQGYLPHEPANNMSSAFQMLTAWEQHYIELDLQLKNIDRHRAMHHLEPYLADQRKIIVQQRSDAKDTIRDLQTVVGVRRVIDSSQDSFATGFNVDAPAYIPSRELSHIDSVPHDHFAEPALKSPVADKFKVNSARRAIPIVAPPGQGTEGTKPKQETGEAMIRRETIDVDEWGVQNRPAPPEIQREQSQLSDMLQAERQRLSGSRDNESQCICGSPSSNRSQQGVLIENISNDLVSESRSVQTTKIESTPDTIPRTNADEIQQVMDAIGKPKGSITQVRLLDGRVINVEGQGLDLSSSSLFEQPDQHHWSKANTKRSGPSAAQFSNRRDGRKHVKGADRVILTERPSGKENSLVAPRGHQKAATDAFLAQYNTIQGSAALAVEPETQSLRTISNSLAEDHRHSTIAPTTAIDFSVAADGLENTSSSLYPTKEFPAYPAFNPNLAFAQTAVLATADDLNNKSYSSVSVQNVNAIGRLPQNLDGSADAQSQLAAAEKAKSPRLLRRHGINGGAWYGPYCREVFERARSQANGSTLFRKHVP